MLLFQHVALAAPYPLNSHIWQLATILDSEVTDHDGTNQSGMEEEFAD